MATTADLDKLRQNTVQHSQDMMLPNFPTLPPKLRAIAGDNEVANYERALQDWITKAVFNIRGPQG